MTILRTSPRRLAALAASAAAALGAGSLSLSAQAAFVTLPVVSGSTTTLTACNPKNASGAQSPTLATCKVTGLPGSAAIPGYILRSSRTAAITVNGVNVGTLYDRVWCLGTGTTCNSTNTYILGARINLNANAWDPSGESFEINDLFRAIRSAASADVAYFMGTSGTSADTAPAFKYLEYTGRTLQGLNEPSGSGLTKTTNNGWANFRADTNADDPDGGNSPWSPWMLVRQVCPSGYNTTAQTQKIRLRQGGEEGQPPTALLTSAYVCN